MFVKTLVLAKHNYVCFVFYAKVAANIRAHSSKSASISKYRLKCLHEYACYIAVYKEHIVNEEGYDTNLYSRYGLEKARVYELRCRLCAGPWS